MVRRLTALVASLLLALLAAPVVPAKEGVRATLIDPVDLDARPGARITIAWTLADAQGHPFGAGGVFVRLRSAGAGRPVTAATDGTGRFAARLTVPDGGIGRIEFGLRGWRSVGGRRSWADVLFPLENDPFARSRAGRARPSSGSRAAPAEDDPLPGWLALLIAVGATGVIAVRASPPHRASAK